MALELPTAWADEMTRLLESRDAPVAGWAPPMDVIERADGLEIRLDVPGVPLGNLHLAVRAGVLLITGEKPHAGCCTGAAFHVAERACGRFSRAVPLRLAFEATAIRATLRHGELRILVPRTEDRRGREIQIPVVAS